MVLFIICIFIAGICAIFGAVLSDSLEYMFIHAVLGFLLLPLMHLLFVFFTM